MKKFISQPNFFRLFSYLVVIITLGFLINNILINFLNINNKKIVGIHFRIGDYRKGCNQNLKRFDRLRKKLKEVFKK